jgi:hypothetical protein
MHVDKSNITKEQVAPYMGDSIPEWQELGLDPKKVYNIYRPAEELEKAVPTFNGLPLMLEHWDMDADTIGNVKEHVVGSLGTDANYEAPYLTNSITIIDAKAIVTNDKFNDTPGVIGILIIVKTTVNAISKALPTIKRVVLFFIFISPF